MFKALEHITGERHDVKTTFELLEVKRPGCDHCSGYWVTAAEAVGLSSTAQWRNVSYLMDGFEEIDSIAFHCDGCSAW